MRFCSWLKSLWACVVVVFVCGGLWLTRFAPFYAMQGEHRYYAYSPSSQALQTDELSLAQMPFVTGESVCFSVQAEQIQPFVRAIIAQYRAQIVFTERAGGRVCLYCFSAELPNGVRINGVPVNLHIATAEQSVAVGTPLIFGGF